MVPSLPNREETSSAFRGSDMVYALLLLALLAVAVGRLPILAFLIIAVCGVVIATRWLDQLCILAFWTLPYMVVNLPTGAFTLKLPEVVAYLLAASTIARVILQKHRLSMPSMTPLVMVYLAILALAAACGPMVAEPFRGAVAPYDRNSPNFRSLSIVIWLGLSWMVVISLYHQIGKRPDLYWRCIRAHILAGGLASFISLGMYVATLKGIQLQNLGGAGITRSLVPQSGDVLRLAGVAYEPLFLAFYLQTVIPITLVALLFWNNLLPRWLTASSLLLQVLALTLTFSAGGWAALTAAMLLLIPLVMKGKIPRRVLMTVGAGAFAALLAGATVFVVFEEYLTIITRITEKITGADRVRQGEWAAGIGIFQDHMLLGVGPGMAGYHFPRYHPLLQSQITTGSVPEVTNLYLMTLTESGLLGFSALISCWIAGAYIMIRAILKRGIGNAPGVYALGCSLAACAIQYLSLNPLFLIYFCVTVGLALSGARLASVHEEKLTDDLYPSSALHFRQESGGSV
jgi:O-antigen ligase